SPTWGRWVGIALSGQDRRQLYVPPGFAHGFCVLSETALLVYKCTERYVPDADRAVLWRDPDIGIEWPIANPVLSRKDSSAPRLRDIDPALLPTYDAG